MPASEELARVPEQGAAAARGLPWAAPPTPGAQPLLLRPTELDLLGSQTLPPLLRCCSNPPQVTQ